MKKLLKDLMELAFVSVLVFLIVYLFVGQLLEVSGQSMEPFIHDKEQIIAEKLTYTLKPIQKGDVVVLTHPSDPSRMVIKRITGVPGDTVIFNSKEILLQKDQYFVEGDNAEHSTDSNTWGPIERSSIIGKAVAVYYPLENIRLLTE